MIDGNNYNKDMTKYFLIPGYSKNSDNHWQSIWSHLPDFTIIEQGKWEDVVKDDWINQIEEALKGEDYSQIVLIGHSLGVATILHWFQKFGHKIKGALLVAPTDIDDLPKDESIAIHGFSPMPLINLPFKSIIACSENDKWISPKRAHEYAKIWGSEFIDVGALGHINADSNIGNWQDGLDLLAKI